jgi:hypothetical protein
MKYAPITEFLIAERAERVRLAFDELEAILGFDLPKSAGDYPAWWANDRHHSQAKAWLEAGWQTENLNLSGRTVEFARVRKHRTSTSGSAAPTPTDPWGALAGTVTIHDEGALTSPTGEIWDAEASA